MVIHDGFPYPHLSALWFPSLPAPGPREFPNSDKPTPSGPCWLRTPPITLTGHPLLGSSTTTTTTTTTPSLSSTLSTFSPLRTGNTHTHTHTLYAPQQQTIRGGECWRWPSPFTMTLALSRNTCGVCLVYLAPLCPLWSV